MQVVMKALDYTKAYTWKKKKKIFNSHSVWSTPPSHDTRLAAIHRSLCRALARNSRLRSCVPALH